MNLQKYIDDKYISVQKHPTEDLYIYNYTQRAQFDRIWTEETMNCRGLIMDGSGKVIARPFKKFFNLEEQENLPAEDFEVFEKMDGSLGILYWIGSAPYLATRGSFTSDQAIRGTEILQDKYADKLSMALNDKWTYLFEIIYPENRIVVDYKGMSDIVLLAAIDTETGEEISYSMLLGLHGNDFQIAKRYDGLGDLQNIKNLSSVKAAQDNKEGFVIRFKSGLRIKLKFEEYVRLHRLITGINARNIWDLLRNNKPLDELLDRVPDEFYRWVKDTANELLEDYEGISHRAYKAFQDAEAHTENRKEFALYVIKKYPDIKHLLFDYKDGHDVFPEIWKMLRPAYEVPFKKEI